MTLKEHNEKINKQWKKFPNRITRIKWSQLEQDLRTVLKSYKTKHITSKEAVILIDNYIAAHTFRGYELRYK